MLTNTLFKRWKYKLFSPDHLQQETYESFKRLLKRDQLCHELMADFQDLYYKNDPTEWTRVIAEYSQLSAAVASMARELHFFSAKNGSDILAYYKKFDSYIRFLLEPEVKSVGPPYIQWLDGSPTEADLIGNKAHNLAKVCEAQPYLVPPGFVVTTNCWRALLEYNNLRASIEGHLSSLDTTDKDSLYDTSRTLMSLIEGSVIPPEIESELFRARDNLVVKGGLNRQVRFAVRSSAVHEDGLHSFAGQYSSILDVHPENVLKSYLRVLASKYSPRALLYRINAGVSDQEASMAVLIVEMIEARAAGVIYTADPAGEVGDTVFIHSVTGKGEKLVDGKARAYLHQFDKNGCTLQKETGTTSPIHASGAEKLAELAMSLERFFGSPQDIEWAINGSGPYVLQSRPLRIIQVENNHSSGQTQERLPRRQDSREGETSLPLLFHGGVVAARGRATGPVCFFSPALDHSSIPGGTILLVDNIPASLILLLPKVNGIIAQKGSVASHFSTICREFGIPLIVEAVGLKKLLVDGEQVTMNADSTNVYRGYDEHCPPKIAAHHEKGGSPYFNRLKLILDFIAPLNMLDPEADSFVPESCRSFHDIIRYVHETGVRAMFAIGKSGSRRGTRKKLSTGLPFELYMLDVSEGIQKNSTNNETIGFDQIMSVPFRALWQGLSHPSINWGERLYYNWKEYDNAAMTDGFAFKNDVESASYAVCGDDYLNLNIRFGYHFTIVDSLCGDNSEQNYCSIRFSGGGGTVEGRYYRLQYIEAILLQLGFKVTRKTDLLDGRLESLPKDQLVQCLVTLGRMLGTSKLMDMVLKDEELVATHLDLFFQCEDEYSVQE